MTNDEILQKLSAKWTADSEGYRSEARRLELADRSRHATSISMLEASAQTLEKCIVDMQTIGQSA